MLSGGHPNSLGRTLEVVESVLADRAMLAELYDCYFSDDAVVRLRTSSALKRICREHPDWLAPYLDRLLGEIADLDQPSVQWTLAQLCEMLERRMTPTQRKRAAEVMKRNLVQSDDWIVLNTTMQILADWSGSDAPLRRWLAPHLERLQRDPRKSVANRAGKLLRIVNGQ